MRMAQHRQAERLKARDPAEWGVSAQILTLPTAREVEVARDQRGQVVRAKRSNPYDVLRSGGGLTVEQYGASQRLLADMALARRVPLGAVHELDQLLERVDGGRGATDGVTQVMIDGARRETAALAGVGPVHRRLLLAINESMLAGEIRVWRVLVQEVNGETHRNSQATTVRQACESLVLVYAAIDAGARSLRET